MKRRRFTLVEVLIAVAILGSALGTTLAIAAQAQLDLIRAQERWADHHALEQAIEHYLLQDPRELDAPGDLLHGGYSASCIVVPIEEGLPEYAIDPYQGWVLSSYTIQVTNSIGDVAGEQIIYKWLPEDDL